MIRRALLLLLGSGRRASSAGGGGDDDDDGGDDTQSEGEIGDAASPGRQLGAPARTPRVGRRAVHRARRRDVPRRHGSPDPPSTPATGSAEF